MSRGVSVWDEMVADSAAAGTRIVTNKAAQLEAKGWKAWLTTLFPFWFGEDFSEEHIEYWELRWSVFQRIKKGEHVPPHELAAALILGRGLGKCLDGDTNITLADGTRTSIRDVAVGTEIVSFNEASGRMERDVISKKWKSGVKPCITLRTRAKKSLTLTADHKVLTFDGWKRAGDISVGDRIASPRRVSVFQTTESRTDEEVRLLAYFIAEGSTTTSQRKGGGECLSAMITNADEPIVSDAINCAESMGFVGRKGVRYAVQFSNGIRGWIRDNGMAGKKAVQKRLPEWVFRLPIYQKWQFISAFIDTDGWIGQNGKIGITLANEQLVLDLQDLLLQVGVPSFIQFRKNDHANAWELLFDQEGVNQNVGYLRLRAKQDTLDRHLATPRYSLIDTYPYIAMRNLPRGVGYWIRRQGLSISHKYDVTRKKMRDAIALYPHPIWQKLESSDVFWDKVVSIEDAGERETFDVEVTKNHNLITNHLVSHNSSTIEAARVMKGALLNGGYSVMISETEDQAQEHLGNCRYLIEHPESKLLEYYPQMAIADNATALKGMPTADRREMFICQNGWILKAKGLSAKMRGLRVGNQRPDDISLDDIDDVNDSLMVSTNKLRLIGASILPILPRDAGTVDIGQNLITPHGVVNQIHEGKTDVLAQRTIIGPSAAFTKLDIASDFDEKGRVRHVILPTSVPSWAGLSIERAQKFLDNSGLETFQAEYQNQFDQFKAGKVIPEYNEEAQLITWSQFEAVFGVRHIPEHWKSMVGLDVGYSEGQHPHYSAWVFIATAAMNSALPGKAFIYRCRSFKGTSIDDQADAIKRDMWPHEKIGQWQMSHERTGEMMTLNQKHGLPFRKFVHYKAEDGVAQWRHVSKCNVNQPNPFKEDEQLEDGTYRIGCPQLYYIVDDDQVKIARDDRGMQLLRQQVSNWEYVPVKLTEGGMTQQKPSKMDDDFCDCAKGVISYFLPAATQKTVQEKFDDKLTDMGLDARAIERAEDERERIALVAARQEQIRGFVAKQKKSGGGLPWRR